MPLGSEVSTLEKVVVGGVAEWDPPTLQGPALFLSSLYI